MSPFAHWRRRPKSILGQPIVVENMPGAGATMGPARVAASKNPDGYMLTSIFSTAFRMPFLRKTTFDPSTDFTYITGVARMTIGLVVRSDAPWQTFDAFLAYAKANPGKIMADTLKSAHSVQSSTIVSSVSPP